MNLPACFECKAARGAGPCFECLKFRQWLRAEGMLAADPKQHPEIVPVQWRASADDLNFEEYLDVALRALA